MKFACLGKLAMTLEYLDNMAANVQLQQAYAVAMSRFVVIEARINQLEQTLEQVIFDPSGSQLPALVEPDIIPKYQLVIKQENPLSLHDNPFTCELQLRP